MYDLPCMTYLGTLGSRALTAAAAARTLAALTAVKRHSPQHTCPHGVIVAFDGGEKQIGQQYSASGSDFTFGCGGLDSTLVLEPFMVDVIEDKPPAAELNA